MALIIVSQELLELIHFSRPKRTGLIVKTLLKEIQNKHLCLRRKFKNIMDSNVEIHDTLLLPLYHESERFVALVHQIVVFNLSTEDKIMIQKLSSDIEDTSISIWAEFNHLPALPHTSS